MRPSDLLVRFFAAAIMCLLAAVIAGLLARAGMLANGRWLALHLAFLGGVSQLVLGAGQFFVAAFLATDPPSRPLIRAQLACWNVGTVLVVAGVPTHRPGVAVAGAVLIAVGLALFAAGLRDMQRRSLQRARWALRWYYACAGFLGVGVLVGVALDVGLAWSAGSLLGAHLALNLAGWLGTAIIGTLHTFHPSLTRTRLRFARLQGPTFAAWSAGTAALAIGLAWDVAPVVVAGWLSLGVAAGLLSANLVASIRVAPRPLSLAAQLVTLAQAFLLAGVTVGLVGALHGDALAEPRRGVLAVLLLAGWLGITVLASLVHLLVLLGHVRDLSRPRSRPRPARDRALVALAACAISALAAGQVASVQALRVTGVIAVVLLYGVLGAHVLASAGRALAPRPRRPVI
jgi:nitrite reductase (NO-forming)